MHHSAVTGDETVGPDGVGRNITSAAVNAGNDSYGSTNDTQTTMPTETEETGVTTEGPDE